MHAKHVTNNQPNAGSLQSLSALTMKSAKISLPPLKRSACRIASPGDHRNNPPEGAVKHTKAHFKSIRACADPTSFSHKDWDSLPSHTELTLDPLGLSKIDPRASAHTITNGHFDCRRTPTAPAATKVVAHEQTDERGTWSDCGVNGFHITPALKHHRDFQCCIPGTKAFWRSNTVDFFPACCDIPTLSLSNHLAAISPDLKDASQNIRTTNLFTETSTEFIKAMNKLHDILALAQGTPFKGNASSKGDEHSKADAGA